MATIIDGKAGTVIDTRDEYDRAFGAWLTYWHQVEHGSAMDAVEPAKPATCPATIWQRAKDEALEDVRLDW